MGGFAVIDFVMFAAGGAVVWVGKDWMMKTFMSAESYANSMKAKADAALAAVKK